MYQFLPGILVYGQEKLEIGEVRKGGLLFHLSRTLLFFFLLLLP